MIHAGCPAFFGFGAKARSCSNFLASTVGFALFIAFGVEGRRFEGVLWAPHLPTVGQLSLAFVLSRFEPYDSIAVLGMWDRNIY